MSSSDGARTVPLVVIDIVNDRCWLARLRIRHTTEKMTIATEGVECEKDYNGNANGSAGEGLVHGLTAVKVDWVSDDQKREVSFMSPVISSM